MWFFYNPWLISFFILTVIIYKFKNVKIKHIYYSLNIKIKKSLKIWQNKKKIYNICVIIYERGIVTIGYSIENSILIEWSIKH